MNWLVPGGYDTGTRCYHEKHFNAGLGMGVPKVALCTGYDDQDEHPQASTPARCLTLTLTIHDGAGQLTKGQEGKVCCDLVGVERAAL